MSRAEAVRAALVDPQGVARALGMSPRRQRAGALVRCPWHDDREPSCSLRVGERGELVAHCFACGASGDVLGLVAAVRGLDPKSEFGRVIEEAEQLASITPAPDARPEPAPPPRRSDREFVELVAPVLHVGRLDGSPLSRDVEAYLEARGLLDEARADGWAALPPDSGRVLADVFGDRAATVLDRSARWPWPSHRLVIPWRNDSGEVSTLQRRCLGEGKGPKYVFPAGRSPVRPYGVERLHWTPTSARVVLVEGAADVLAARRRFPSDVVLGLPGVGSVSRPGMLEGLLGGRHVLVGLDPDEAGEKASQALAARAYELGAVGVVERVFLASGADWAHAS